MIFRFMGGAHEEGHNFTLAGHRWLHEPDDPNSNLYDSQFVHDRGVLQHGGQRHPGHQAGYEEPGGQKAREAADRLRLHMVLPGGAGAPGDYLYSSQPLNDLWMGMWGIFRVPAKRVRGPAAAARATPRRRRAPPGQEWPALQAGGAESTARLTSANAMPLPTVADAAHLQHQPGQDEDRLQRGRRQRPQRPDVRR